MTGKVMQARHLGIGNWDYRSVASRATRRTRRTFADDPSVATFHTGQMTQYYDADQPSQTEANEPVMSRRG